MITYIYDALFFYESGVEGPTIFIPDLSGATCGDSDNNGIFMAKDLINCLLDEKHISCVPVRRSKEKLFQIIPITITVKINKSGIIVSENIPLETYFDNIDITCNAIVISNIFHPHIYQTVFFPEFDNTEFFSYDGIGLPITFHDELKHYLTSYVGNKSLSELPHGAWNTEKFVKIVPIEQNFDIDNNGILHEIKNCTNNKK
jgi:hypothetical protein